jgi:PST family polysaccharide transporter
VTSTRKSSYTEILTSSALIGASSVLDIALRVIRVKVMAVLLGPAGVGVMGLFASVADLAFGLSAFGVDNSGVRQIARSVGTGDREQIALTARVLRRACLALGAIGAVLLTVFSREVSQVTFGTREHALAVVLLSAAVFLRVAYAGQAALLRGLRRIGDLARMEVFGAFLATAVTVPLIYFLREDGIVPSLVASAAAMMLSAWLHTRGVDLGAPTSSRAQRRQEVSALLRLGFAFMVTALITMGVAYAVRVIVLRQLGADSAGYYQSAWTIGGLYVGFILQAMGTDFYPRLTAHADDHAHVNRMVNEQVLVSLLLAGPGVLATLTLTPLVITLFYSAKFGAAVETLRWICLGMSLRVITWPLGFIVVAKGMQAMFIWIDLVCALVHLGLAWLLVRHVGLDGAGMAFFGLYVFHAGIIYPIARRVTGFRWSRANKQVGAVYVPLIALVFAGFYVLPPAWAIAAGSTAVLVTGIGSLRILVSLVPPDGLPTPVRRVLDRVGILGPGHSP